MSDMLTDSILKKDTELVYDKNYVNSVYKRTERIVSACFYIADKIEENKRTPQSPLAPKIYDASSNVSDTASKTLQYTHSSVKGMLVVLTTELVRLASLVHTAAATERVPASHAMAVQYEIDALVDILDQMRVREYEVRRPLVRDRRRPFIARVDQREIVGLDQAVSVTDSPETHPGAHDRKDKIKDILREKGQIGIKDISDVIKDVSEKSIQRDLNDLIESGTVVRIGERRWSTYRLA